MGLVPGIELQLQAIALGRIVDDAAVSQVGNERWARTFFEFVDRALLVQNR